jgi:hypothetical protein
MILLPALLQTIRASGVARRLNSNILGGAVSGHILLEALTTSSAQHGYDYERLEILGLTLLHCRPVLTSGQGILSSNAFQALRFSRIFPMPPKSSYMMKGPKSSLTKHFNAVELLLDFLDSFNIYL